MADEPQEHAQATPRVKGRKRRIARRALAMFVLVLGIAVVMAWMQRREIADDLIGDMLAENGVRASYRVTGVSTRRQVIRDIVIGDPARPDLTIDRAVVHIAPRFGFPKITGVDLGEARLFGTYRDGTLSFGALDPLVFTGSDQPFEFPELDLTLRDGRALIQSDFGDVGVKLAGRGNLRGGFAGQLAAIAPSIAFAGCETGRTTLFGQLTIDAERPRFDGPLRFDALDCPGQSLAVRDAALQLDLRPERNLTDLTGEVNLRAGPVALASNALAGLEGYGRFVFRSGDLTATYDLEGRDVRTGPAQFATFAAQGGFRAREKFAQLELDGTVDGRGMRIGEGARDSIAGLAASADGTLLAPLLSQAIERLDEEMRVSSLAGDFTLRNTPEGMSAIVPSLALRGTSGSTLLALTRGQVSMRGGQPVASGNFKTGGQGLPLIAGRIENVGTAGPRLIVRMGEYAAGDAQLAVPRLEAAWRGDGSVALDGEVLASGAVPGGSVRNLALPVSGLIGSNGSIALWSGCTRARFDSLSISSLALQRQSLLLCPPAGRSIVRYDARGLALAAGVPSLDLKGQLAQTPVAIRSGPVGLAWPGKLAARSLDVTLGPPGTATRFAIADLEADIGSEIAGRFAGTDLFMDAVPLDVLQANGSWRYAGGVLALADARFVLQDRQPSPRFEPLAGSDGRITLQDNVIRGSFALSDPKYGQDIADVTLRHDLSAGAGGAELQVPGIVFARRGLQPIDLSQLALGVIANVDGTVTGSGSIAWDARGVTSTGAFSSEALDFAAAFGPVQGASGTIRFTDLLGLTTAPRQVLKVAAINPGIEVYDGEIALSLVGGQLLRFEGGTWPFLGGTLTMRPVDLNLGAAEERRYVLVIDGLDAARFVERMQLGNLAVTGLFDGTIPLVFDKDGNGQLQNGVLVSRPPGGNVAYIGQLTYEDLSYIGNFAFQTLRDLDYDRMEIVMNGPLTGELVTRVRFDGIRQGEDAKSNIITRQIAKLPVRLLVNVRAPFYSLISSVRSLYDPSAVRDPRGLGLVRDDGTVLRRDVDQETVEAQDAAAAEAAAAALQNPPDEPDIQPPESEAVP